MAPDHVFTCAIKTINTQPPPYRVIQMATNETIRPHLPTAFSPIQG